MSAVKPVGIFEYLFGRSKPTPAPADVVHPLFGPIYMDTASSWFAERTDPFGCGGTPSLSIAGGNEGPFPGSVETYRRLRDEWATIAPSIAETLLELNHNYFSDNPEKQLRAAMDIWSTATLQSLGVGPDGNIDLTYTFSWQRPGDDHSITVYLEDWVPQGTSIDG